MASELWPDGHISPGSTPVQSVAKLLSKADCQLHYFSVAYWQKRPPSVYTSLEGRNRICVHIAL